MSKSSNSSYIRKHILPRLFHVFDSKKDGVLDLDEYCSAVALFRAGPLDEKIKCESLVLSLLAPAPQPNRVPCQSCT